MRVALRQRWHLRWAALLLLPVAVVSGARDEWRHARTEHFEVLSAASEKQTRQLIVELEQFRASFIATFGLRPAHEPRVTVMIFNSDRSFTPFKPIYQGRSKDVSGIYVRGTDEIVIALNASRDTEYTNPTETILHEYVHLLVDTRRLHLPVWLNEGLAELFSTFRVVGDRVEYGRPKQSYVDALNILPLMPMDQLTAVTESSPEYNEEFRAGMFYAQSWALTHFLMCGEDRSNSERLQKFLQTLDQTSTPADVAFREVFGKEFDRLEQKLRNYLQGGRYYQRRAPVMLKDVAAKITLRPATEAERDFALLNLRWRVHQSGDAMLAALQLVEKSPGSPRPHELLAAIEMHAMEPARALERWRQAAELNTENPFILVQGARAKLAETGLLADLDARLSEEDTAQLRRWLERAAQLSPLYDEAVELLAVVEARAPEFRIATINRIQQHVRQMKDPNPTFLALALIRWRARDVETANKIVAAVLGSGRARGDTKAAAELIRQRFSGELRMLVVPTTPAGVR